MRISKPHKFLFIGLMVFVVLAASAQDQESDSIKTADEVTQDEFDQEAFDFDVEQEVEREEYGKQEYFEAYDSTQVTVRSFDSTKLIKFKNDPNYQYGTTHSTRSAWDEFWRWVGQLLQPSTETRASVSIDFLYYAIAIAFLAFAVIKLMKLDSAKIFFSRKNTSTKDSLIIEENIHEMDFEKLILDAQAKKDYRLTIRLFFLYGLKLLSDRQYVYWEPGKTNHEYLLELKEKDLQSGFHSLNYYFEYTWYGNFTISQATFAAVQSLFVNWKSKIA